jgi:molybdopterin-guanine dinucleotide biosynthesis protein A
MDPHRSPERYADLAAVLLAGGRSLRMGADKALLRLGETPVVALLKSRLLEVTDEVLLSANDPETYRFLALPCVTDRYPDCGPLAGLHAAMLHTCRPWLLALACDLPAITSTLLRSLYHHAAGYDAVVPVTADGRRHPVCALYHRSCLPAMERNLISGENRLIRLLRDPGLRIRQLTAAEGDFTDSILIDVNAPEDFALFQKQAKP